MDDTVAVDRTLRRNRTTLDILYGNYIRNVSSTDDDFNEISYAFEGEYPNLGDGTFSTATPPVPNTETAYQYAVGNQCNSMAISLPLTDKAVVTFGFVGTDTANPTTDHGLVELHYVPEQPTRSGAFNTSSDIARLGII